MPAARPSATLSEITRAIEVFVHGFSFTRSFAHPYVPQRVGPLWVVRDAPRKNDHDYRREEWVAHDLPADEVDRIAKEHTRGRFAVCAIHAAGEDDQRLRAAYKVLGYRLATTEPLMAHDLRRIPPRCDSPATIERVTTVEMAQRVARMARARQILPEHLSDGAPIREYVASIDGQLVGRVGSIRTPAGFWCSNMYVLPAFRRRGIGRALLGRMLRDNRAAGANFAVLTASHTGAKLYATVGYEQLATLYVFTPGRRQRR